MASGDAANVEVSPIDLLWQIESSFTADFTNVTAAGFGGTSFTFFAGDGTSQFYAWGDENSLDADPVETGTAIEVDYAAGASATVIAAAVQVAIDALGDFSATVSGAVVTVTNAAIGNVTDVVNTDVTNLVLTVCRRGQNLDLGLLQDVVDLNLAPSTFVVNAQQFGNTPLSSIFTGYETVEMSCTILETKFSNLQPLYELYGGNITPSAGTEIFGVGTNKTGVNLLLDAARLIAKPVNSSDNLSNTVLALAIPVPDTLSFSGTEPRTLSITWQGFADLTINSKINTLFFGDQAQVLT